MQGHLAPIGGSFYIPKPQKRSIDIKHSHGHLQSEIELCKLNDKWNSIIKGNCAFFQQVLIRCGIAAKVTFMIWIDNSKNISSNVHSHQDYSLICHLVHYILWTEENIYHHCRPKSGIWQGSNRILCIVLHFEGVEWEVRFPAGQKNPPMQAKCWWADC